MNPVSRRLISLAVICREGEESGNGQCAGQWNRVGIVKVNKKQSNSKEETVW